MKLNFKKLYLAGVFCSLVFALISCSAGSPASDKTTQTELNDGQWQGITCYEYVTRRREALEKSLGMSSVVAQLKQQTNQNAMQQAPAQKMQAQKLRQQLMSRISYLFHQLNTKLENEMQHCIFVQLQAQPQVH